MMHLSENVKWFVEKVLIPVLVAIIAAYATLTVAGIFSNPFGKGEDQLSTFSSISSNSSVNALNEGQILTSPNKQHELKIENGNVILYSNGNIAWMTNTKWSGGNHLVMQGDGNLVLYADERFVWNTDTPVDPPAKSYTFNILDNGNLVVSDSAGKMVWSIK